MKYDWVVVGAGLYGATFARLLAEEGKRVLVVDRRGHVAGNCHTNVDRGTNVIVHEYGPHIFHTNNSQVWGWMCRFADMVPFFLHVKALAPDGRLYTLPFSMQTFYEIYHVRFKFEVQQLRAKWEREATSDPDTVQGWCERAIGPEAYDLLVRGYSTKQWGRSPDKMPASVVRRLPLRTTWDTRYHSCVWSGIPRDGYTAAVSNMLSHPSIDVRLLYDAVQNWKEVHSHSNLMWTAPVDLYFAWSNGQLEYRRVEFRHKVVNADDYQGAPVVHDTDGDVSYTRVIEHKHFMPSRKTDGTVVTHEYPHDADSSRGVAAYPVRDAKNLAVYDVYKKRASRLSNVYFGGRLGKYQYYDMDQVVASAMKDASKLKGV